MNTIKTHMTDQQKQMLFNEQIQGTAMNIAANQCHKFTRTFVSVRCQNVC